jgi:TP901 family phage tail tape measure protein
MLVVKGVTGATGAAFRALTDQAKELGRTTSFTATEVAGLQTELGRAGFSTSEIDAATGSILNLARATQTDLPTAAGIAAATIRQFGLEASEAGRIADALTLTANKTFNTLGSIGEALKFAAPVALDFDVPLEDTLALVGALGNIGIQGSMAGSTLRRLFTLSGAESEKLTNIFGVDFADSAGNARPLIDVLAEVNTATADLGTAARSQKFNQAFGLLGITGASALGRAAGPVRELRDALLDAGGTAASIAGIMDSKIGGSFRMMMSATQGVALEIGEILEPAMMSLVGAVKDAAGAVTEFIKRNPELVVTFAAASAASLTAAAALITLGGTISVLAFSISAFGPIATRAFSMMTGPARLAATSLGMIWTAGSSAALASTVLSRAAGRSALMLTRLGAFAFTASVGVLSLARSFVMIAVGPTVGMLKQVAFAMGRLAITALRTARRLYYMVAIVPALGSALGSVVSNFYAVAKAAMIAGFSITRTVLASLSLTRIAAMAKVAAGGIWAMTTSLLAFATTPAAMFAMMSAGLALAVYTTVGSFSALKGQSSAMANDVGSAMRSVAAQSVSAWTSVTTVARTSIGTIVDLIKEGKMQKAFSVSMAAIKLAWAKTAQSFLPTWVPVSVGFDRAFSLIGQFFDEAVTGMKKRWSGFGDWFSNDGTSEFTSSWADTAATFSELWVIAIDKIKETWDEFYGAFMDIKDITIRFFREDGVFKDPEKAKEAGDRINQRASDDRKRKKEREDDKATSFDSIERDRAKNKREDAAAAKAKQDDADDQVVVAQADLDIEIFDVEIEKAKERIASLRKEIDQQLEFADAGVDIDTTDLVASLVSARQALSSLQDRRAVSAASREAAGGAPVVPDNSDAIAKAEAELQALEDKRGGIVGNTKLTAELEVELKAAEAKQSMLEAAGVAPGQIAAATAEVEKLTDQLDKAYASNARVKTRPAFNENRDEIDAKRDEIADLRAAGASIPKTPTDTPTPATPTSETAGQAGAALPDVQSGEGFFAELKPENSQGRALSDREADSIFGGKKKKLETDADGNQYDPETGKTLDEMKAESAADVYGGKGSGSRTGGRGASQGLERVQNRISGSTGTFSSTAAGRIAGSSKSIDRVAKATEAGLEHQKMTAQNTGQALEKMDNQNHGIMVK